MKTIDNDIIFMISGAGSNGGNNGGGHNSLGHAAGSTIGGFAGGLIEGELGGGLGAAVGNRVGSEIGGRIGDHMHEAPSVSHTPAGIGTENHWWQYGKSKWDRSSKIDTEIYISSLF